MFKYNGGHLEVITGPMFAGKTEELIRRLTRAEIAGQDIIAFKPLLDDRYKREKIVSHNGNEIESFIIDNVVEIYAKTFEESKKSYDVVAIDEVQFFEDKTLITVLEMMVTKGVRIIMTGLDTDFRGKPFPMMEKLLCRAERVDKLTAICHKCGSIATKTQRLIDGEPADYDEPTIKVGGKEVYEARCRECHEIDFNKFIQALNTSRR